MATKVCGDTVLVGLSLFLTVGYHAYLCHVSKSNPSHTSLGIDTLRRRHWLQAMKEGDDKKGMLAVQSMRNALMVAILAATVSALVIASLAALANNTLSAAHLFQRSVLFGSQDPRIFVLKYGSASIFLSASFLCSSLAIAFLVDANFLFNARGDPTDLAAGDSLGGAVPVTHHHVMDVMERGFVLALLGNRLLCLAFPLLLWMLGPWPVLISSLMLLWVLYGMDFAPKPKTSFYHKY